LLEQDEKSEQKSEIENESENEEVNELTEDEELEEDKDYDYLLSMPIWSLTLERAQKLESQLKEKEKELSKQFYSTILHNTHMHNELLKHE
jgi:DNA topoisomerase-2